jgi:hypothetical protein
MKQTKWDELVEQVCRRKCELQDADPDQIAGMEEDMHPLWEVYIGEVEDTLSAYFSLYGSLKSRGSVIIKTRNGIPYMKDLDDDLRAYEEMKEEAT